MEMAIYEFIHFKGERKLVFKEKKTKQIFSLQAYARMK